MKRATILAPAALCAVICFQALVIAAAGKISWSQSLFYVVLPVCFLLMAGVMIRLSRDLSRLRRRVAKLEGKAFPDSRPDRAGHPAETDTDFSSEPDHSASAQEPRD